MGYYCTVPQCTSLAGKTKNVKFHRFPRDTTMADKWNLILKRGKPYTKYSKVCSLHFTQADYNVTTMGQWKTLSKDAIPSQNLPKLNPDGTVMMIRKSRTVKYRDGKKDDTDKSDKWQLPMTHQPLPLPTPDVVGTHEHDNVLAYRLQTLGHMASNVSGNMSTPHPISHVKPKKQDAIMQTDPVQNEDDDTQPNNSYSEVSEKSYSSEIDQYGYPKDADYPMKENESYPKDGYKDYPKEGFSKDYPKDAYKDYPKEYPKEGFIKESYPKEGFSKDGYKDYPKEGYKDYSNPKEGYSKDYSKESYDKEPFKPKNYSKPDDYIPQTNEEYNKAAEKYALERKSHNGYDLKEVYPNKLENYTKLPNVYYDKTYPRDLNPYLYQNYADSVDPRNQYVAQDHRTDNPGVFNENHIKQEIDITDDDKYLYERAKEQLDTNPYNERRVQHQRFLDHLPVKLEPDANACNIMQPQGSPYYPPTSHNNIPGYYDPLTRPGPELLIAKQNALAAHTQLWQNTMKRPFFYSENPPYNGPQLLHRYEASSKGLE